MAGTSNQANSDRKLTWIAVWHKHVGEQLYRERIECVVWSEQSDARNPPMGRIGGRLGFGLEPSIVTRAQDNSEGICLPCT
jgi:hypothetical protein